MNENELHIGVDERLRDVCFSRNALTRGLVLVGQSGCGKSFLLGRVIEKLARTANPKSRVLVVDPNSDYCFGLQTKGVRTFRSLLRKYSSGELDHEEYKDFEDRELDLLRSMKQHDAFKKKEQVFGRGRDKLVLRWAELIHDNVSFLRLVKGNEYSPTYELLSLLWLTAASRQAMKTPDDALRSLEEYILDSEKSKPKYLSTDPKRVKRLVAEHHEANSEFLVDMVKETASQLWIPDSAGDALPRTLFKRSRHAFLDLGTVDQSCDQMKILLVVLNRVLHEHKRAVEQLRVAQLNGSKDRIKRATSRLRSTFIVIDEAQRFASSDPQSSHVREVGELLHEIAAEGRKFGVHLIIATQRPMKVKPGLLGECDNAMILKMNSRSDLEHLAKQMRILDVKLLERCLHFQGTGSVIGIGEMTGMAPFSRMFRSAPRRTLEGGPDIPPAKK